MTAKRHAARASLESRLAFPLVSQNLALAWREVYISLDKFLGQGIAISYLT